MKNNKTMKLHSILSFGFVLNLALSTISWSQVISGENQLKLNDVVNEILKIRYDGGKSESLPYFYTIPENRYLEMSEIQEGSKGESVPGTVFDYVHPSTLNSDSKVGLRMFLVDGTKNRKALSKKLADSGVLQTGDVVLSFRNEWAGTGAYSHAQLGISHAGLIFIDKDGYAQNVDMPLDHHYIQDAANSAERSYVSGSHYTEGNSKKPDVADPLLHIVRPRGLTEAQKRNIEAWSDEIVSEARAGRIYKSKFSFNTDYQAPAFMNFAGDLNQQVFDLGRVIKGGNVKGKYSGGFKMYCSEFVWSMLSLRDCSMSEDFSGSSKPNCISPIYSPLSPIGSYLPNTNNPSQSKMAGLTDGPLMVLSEMGNRMQTLESEVDQIFNPTVPLNNISSGHQEVMKSIPKELWGALRVYYRLSYLENMEKNPNISAVELEAIALGKQELLKFANQALAMVPAEQKAGIMMAMKVQTLEIKEAQDIAKIVNAINVSNYSPTSFLIHALLPKNHEGKKFDYVGTLLKLNASGNKKVQAAKQ